jgi:hypothetical protein
MKNLTERYLEYYTPLIQQFIKDVEPLSIPNINEMPEPFLPLFGKDYEQSALRIIFIGQDTKWWWDLREFIQAETAAPGKKLRERLDQFRQRAFTQWGKTRYTFWGFVMMTIAVLHGRKDWELMKKGAMVEILNSIAWGNVNAIEYFTSSASKRGVPEQFWHQVRLAGEPLNRFHHVVQALAPRVVVLLHKGLNAASYFEGYQIEKISQQDGIAHYRLPQIPVDLFHVPHPVRMKFDQGADHFCTKLAELLIDHKLAPQFPHFVSGQAEAQGVMDFLHRNAPAQNGCDKFEFVSWVANQLKKYETFMSVPALCELLNKKGYRTNYGTEYDGGRGSYRLVRSAYYRKKNTGDADSAHNIAIAFRRPNFAYTYSTEEEETVKEEIRLTARFDRFVSDGSDITFIPPS